MSRGWKREPVRHGLASRGISTKHMNNSNFVRASSIDVEEFESYLETKDWIDKKNLNVSKERVNDRLVAHFQLPSNFYGITSVQSIIIFDFSNNKLKGQIRFPILTKEQFKEIEDDVYSTIDESDYPLNFEPHLTSRGNVTPHSFFEINRVNTNYIYENLDEIGNVINEILKEYPNEDIVKAR